jgi:hypothetical protein
LRAARIEFWLRRVAGENSAERVVQLWLEALA